LGLCISCKEALLVMGAIVPFVPKIGAKEEKTPTVFGENAMLWHQRSEHIREKGI
jgi:hypothetical protein